MVSIPDQMMKNIIAAILAFLAPTLIYLLGWETNFIHNTSPTFFIMGAALITACFGTIVSRIRGQLGGLGQYIVLFACLFAAYSGIAWFLLNSGYFIWFVIPLEIALQAAIARKIVGSKWSNIWWVALASVLIFIAGGLVSQFREIFAVTNENYFLFLFFLHPQLSILLSRSKGKAQ